MTKLKPFAFVLMPFDKAFEDIYRLGIKETCAKLEIVAERVDEQIYSETILERIYRQIRDADFIIADMTGRNPNVFYEVGYAHAIGKRCTLLTQTADDIPFDLKHHRHIVYANSIGGLKSQLHDELIWHLEETKVAKQRPFDLELKCIGSLEKSDAKDQGTLDLTVDIINQSGQRSSEIEAIYMHATKPWSFSQEDKRCPRKDNSDGTTSKFLLQPPLRRIAKGAWAQISLEGSKRFWSKYTGEERRDTYNASGKLIFEINTSEGNFNIEKNIDVDFEEFPF